MGKARLADFGISRQLPKGQTTHRTSRAGTKCWMAKETLAGEADIPYKTMTDIQVTFSYTNYSRFNDDWVEISLLIAKLTY